MDREEPGSARGSHGQGELCRPKRGPRHAGGPRLWVHIYLYPPHPGSPLVAMLIGKGGCKGGCSHVHCRNMSCIANNNVQSVIEASLPRPLSMNWIRAQRTIRDDITSQVTEFLKEFWIEHRDEAMGFGASEHKLLPSLLQSTNHLLNAINC